jgi:hypothetical protein
MCQLNQELLSCLSKKNQELLSKKKSKKIFQVMLPKIEASCF